MSHKEHPLWMCHICDYTSKGEESSVCSICYKTTCPAHLKPLSVFNRDSGLYEIQPVCLTCTLSKSLS